MNFKKLFVSAFAVLIIVCASAGICAQAEEDHVYYVSEISGSDSNDGKTAECAFRTLKAAVKAIGNADGTVKIMDTVYWNFDSKRSNVAEHTGTITFEGLSSDNVQEQIIDYSEMNEDAKESADLLISGPTVFRNVTLRSHFNKALFTNSQSLTLSGTIRHINDNARDTGFVIYVGNPSAHSTNDSLTIDADISVSSVNFGHNFSHKLMGKTTFRLLSGNIDSITLCNKGAICADVDIGIYNGNVKKFSVFKGGRVSGRLAMIVNTSVCPDLSDISVVDGNDLVICSPDGGIMDICADNTLHVNSDKTAVITCKETGTVLYSPYGGSIILDNGVYSVSAEDKLYYTNDGRNITVFEPVAIDLERMCFENMQDKENILCGWVYKDEKYGPLNNTLLPSGTVLEADIQKYDPSGDEFGITGCQIREEGAQSLRFITKKSNSFDEKFKIVEYGTLVAPSSYYESDGLYLDSDYKDGFSARVPAVNTLEKSDNGILYTACLTGISKELYGEIYCARSYALCEGANGRTFALYSDIYSTSVGRVAGFATQNKNSQNFEKIVSEWKGICMKDIKNETNEIYEKAYSVSETGTHVRELTIDSGRADEKTSEIALITDMHLHLDSTFTNAADNAMKVAKLSDAIVLCGDNIDSVTHIPLLQKHVLSVDKSLMYVMGNHELLNETSADTVANRKLIDAAVPHDTKYFSRVLHNRVLLVTADDCEYTFTEEQCDRLEKDIALARENNYPVLLFYHAKITDTKNGSNQRMYNIIKDNADVIKAVFNGHYHVDDMYTIPGTYKDENGETVKRDIPCYLLRGNAEDGGDGNVLKIIVK